MEGAWGWTFKVKDMESGIGSDATEPGPAKYLPGRIVIAVFLEVELSKIPRVTCNIWLLD